VAFKGLKFKIAYEIYDQEGKTLHARGTTEHCFLNNDFKPVSIKREAPDLFEFFSKKN
jgi:acyl-CoA thioester hydrolase